MKLTEMKMSIHRKYTKNYQSFGYGIGMMVALDENETSLDCYAKMRQAMDVLSQLENEKIKNEMKKLGLE